MDDPGSSAAGWRGLDPTDNLPWLLDAAVHSGGGGVEAILPLADLYGAPTGATRTVGVVVRLVSTTGEYASNQMLPESGAATLELSY